MTAFQETIRDRKALVPSARRRVCGSKTRFVGLPHDNLSPAQLRKLNGKVATYNMHQPMTWSSFKDMPNDLAQEYISYLGNNFHVNYGALERAFGVSSNMIRNIFEKKEVSFTPNHGRMTKEDTDAFRNFWDHEFETPLIKEAKKDIPQEESQSNDPAPVHTSMRLSSASLDFEGEFHSVDVMQSIKMLLNEGMECKIHIEIQK